MGKQSKNVDSIKQAVCAQGRAILGKIKDFITVFLGTLNGNRSQAAIKDEAALLGWRWRSIHETHWLQTAHCRAVCVTPLF